MLLPASIYFVAQPQRVMTCRTSRAPRIKITNIENMKKKKTAKQIIIYVLYTKSVRPRPNNANDIYIHDGVCNCIIPI